MKKAISSLLAVALVLSVFTTVFTVSALANEPDNVKVITNAEGLANAIANQQANETWKLTEGTYNLTQECLDLYADWSEPGQGNWYFPIHEQGITIIGEGDVTVTSDVVRANGVWASQDFISVWADDVTIDNIDILSKEEQNKAIEIMAKNFTLKNSEIKKVNEWGSGSIIFNAQNDAKDIGSATLENVKLYSWVTASYSQAGTLNTKGVTIDFTDNDYAGYYDDTYGYGWSPVVKGPKNGTVNNQSITLLVDSKIDLNGQVFTSNLQPYTTVKLTEDIAVDEMVNVTGKNVTFDLGGNTITASEDFTGTFDNDKHLVQIINAENVNLINGTIKTTDSNKNTLNVYDSTGVVLSNLTLDHTNAFSGAPLIVNGSNVSVEGSLSLVTGDASWYGINVDNEGTLSFAQNSSVSMEGDKALLLVENGEVKNPENAGIVMDGNVGREEIFANGISLNAANKTLTVGETFTLEATVSPENTDNKTVTFTSSDASVATVDANGVVKAVKAGKATITATCGDVSAVCEITVNAPTEIPDTDDNNLVIICVAAALILAAAACTVIYRKRAK